ncbi:MAG: hypothetical protein BGO25_03160 [Acidobacteriales bacterium 59-55]|nr:MAG: hypothetical protein BGO25_03160 [Acidobacteriales bacterium 59-55]
MDICPYCGDSAYLDVSDVLIHTREINLDACCEWNLAGWIDSIQSFNRRERAQWALEATGLVVHDILTKDGALRWTLHYGLEIGEVMFSDVKEFIREHHRHCDPPSGWKYGAALFNGDDMVAVMAAGRPGSRHLDAQGCMEITRVCVKDMEPHGLVANACSILYGYGCREAFKRGYKRVVTYTKKGESGASLRAAGFAPVAVSDGGEWDRPGRPRRPGRNTVPKVRWERWQGKVIPVQRSLQFEPPNRLSIAA